MARRPSYSQREIINTRPLVLDPRHPGAPGAQRGGDDSEKIDSPGIGTPELTAPKNLSVDEDAQKLVRLTDGSLRVQAVVEFDSVAGATDYEAEVFRV